MNNISETVEENKQAFENFKARYVVDMQSYARDIKELSDNIQSRFDSMMEYNHQHDDDVDKFLQTMMDNVTLMQKYVSIQLLESQIKAEIALEQAKALTMAPWYMKLFKRQRQKILDYAELKVKDSYVDVKNSYQDNLRRAINEVLSRKEGNN